MNRRRRHRLLVTDPAGKTLFENRHAAADNEDNGLFIDIFDWIENYLGDGGLAGVGHRIVHGGGDFSGPIEMTSEVLDALWALTPLAPCTSRAVSRRSAQSNRCSQA